MRSFVEMAKMPWIQLFASTACNLKCEYCSQSHNHHKAVTSNILRDSVVLEFVESIPPTHFYVSGGEPFIHDGVADFVNLAGSHGHVVSFDTNIVINKDRLEKLLADINLDYVGFINISHHLVENISLEYIVDRAEIIRSAGIGQFVKYVGVPEFITDIETNMRILRDKGIGAAVTILQGPWRGRNLPDEYTPEEMYRLLNLVTTYTHGLQFFDGLTPNGMQCKGGQDWLVFNMNEDMKFLACCHGGKNEVNLEDTFFMTGDRTPKSCDLENCLGDLMYIIGLNGVIDESERFDRMLRGDFEFIGSEKIADFVHSLKNRKYTVAGYKNYYTYKNYLKSLPHPAKAVEPAPAKIESNPDPTSCVDDITCSEGKKMSSETLRKLLEQELSQWKSPDQVITANPELAPIFKQNLSKLAHSNPKIFARSLGKLVLQNKYLLPRKANFELAAVCNLNCVFCDLGDMREFRSKRFMSHDAFLRIWKYMEVFTTEVELTGGEPLLDAEIPHIIDTLRATGVFVTLTTNGQMLDEKHCEMIVNHAPSRLLIAMDGVDAETYGKLRRRGKFDRLIANIDRLVEKRNRTGATLPEVHVQMVVNRENVNQVEPYYHMAAALNVDKAFIKPMLVWPDSTEEFKKTLSESYLIDDPRWSYHKIDANKQLIDGGAPEHCPNTQHVHIGCGGEVLPCWYILKESFIAGNASEKPFLSIWYSERYQAFRQQMEQGKAYKACQGCIGKYEAHLFHEKNRSELKQLLIESMVDDNRKVIASLVPPPLRIKPIIPVVSNELKPPTEGEWLQGWHGYYFKRESFLEASWLRYSTLLDQPVYDAYVLELFAFLSIIEQYDGVDFRMFELGSGRAPWCMTLAGAMTFSYLKTRPKSYRCLAVEGEPKHYQWSRDHLLLQNIPADVVFGAISNHNGSCRFLANPNESASSMGQAVSSKGNIEVPCYTIDQLMSKYYFPHVHAIHMDVQGEECHALEGAKQALANKAIDYFIIGTHGTALETELKEQLSPTHELVAELLQHQTARFDGIDRPFHSVEDGVQVWRRKS